MAAIDPVPSGLLGYGTGDGSGPLSRLLRDNVLSPVFQPIVSMVDASIYAHEALIRGPQGTPLHMPDALLAAASKEGLLLDFEIACVVCALERWAALAQPGRLFVNLSQSALLQMVNTRFSESLLELIRKLGLQPRMDNGGAFEDARQRIAAACLKRNIAPGIHGDASLAAGHAAAGYRMITITSDIAAIAAGALHDLALVRGEGATKNDAATTAYP